MRQCDKFDLEKYLLDDFGDSVHKNASLMSRFTIGYMRLRFWLRTASDTPLDLKDGSIRLETVC
jgi:hypothetical protein